MAKVYLDPITRIEGHLSIEMEVQNGRVTDAWSKGDMFRGFEKILRGRNPVDANQITQRICGVCPVSHGLASSKCLDVGIQYQTEQKRQASPKPGARRRTICNRISSTSIICAPWTMSISPPF